MLRAQACMNSIPALAGQWAGPGPSAMERGGEAAGLGPAPQARSQLHTYRWGVAQHKPVPSPSCGFLLRKAARIIVLPIPEK